MIKTFTAHDLIRNAFSSDLTAATTLKNTPKKAGANGASDIPKSNQKGKTLGPGSLLNIYTVGYVNNQENNCSLR